MFASVYRIDEKTRGTVFTEVGWKRKRRADPERRAVCQSERSIEKREKRNRERKRM